MGRKQVTWRKEKRPTLDLVIQILTRRDGQSRPTEMTCQIVGPRGCLPFACWVECVVAAKLGGKKGKASVVFIAGLTGSPLSL